MSVSFVFPVLLALLTTQTAHATDVVVLPFNYGASRTTEGHTYMFTTRQPPPPSVIQAVIADSGLAPGSVDHAIAKAQTLPQSQASPSHPHHHTLRNIVIITVAVGVMVVVLAAAAKK